jgi:hypothetical protein
MAAAPNWVDDLGGFLSLRNVTRTATDEHRKLEVLELLALGLTPTEAAELLEMRLRTLEQLIAGQEIPELEPGQLQTSVARTLYRRRRREGRAKT